MLRPKPRQVSQAPIGELKLKVLGLGSLYPMSQSGQCSSVENRHGAADGAGLALRVDVEPAVPDLERGLDGVVGARGFDRLPAKAVLHHLQRVAAPLMDAGVALAGEQCLDLRSLKFFGMATGKVSSRRGSPLLAGALCECVADAAACRGAPGLRSARQCKTAARANSSFR